MDFYGITSAMNQASITQLANTRPAASSYLLAAILPPIQRATYEAKSGRMRVISTMAGMVGMDSPYPEGSFITGDTFSENTLKIAQAVSMPEARTREIQAMIQSLGLGAVPADPQAILTNALLNLYEKGVLQALDDTEEWMRAQALTTGRIDWTFAGNKVSVDYGLGAESKPATRTGAQGYGAASSTFWADIRAARKYLKSVRVFLMSGDTLDMILDNNAHQIVVQSDTESQDGMQRTVTIRRAIYNEQGTAAIALDRDARNSVTLVAYNRLGTVLAPTKDNPRQTAQVQFIPDGTIVAVGNNQIDNILSLDGTPTQQNALGYTHIAPTVEGQGTIGRWGRIYTPQERPWAARAEGVANVLPVIEAPEKLMLLTSEVQ